MQLTPDKEPSPANVLLVDDDSKNLLALSEVLGPLGQNILQARSGPAALRLLLEHDFAVILLDVRMPGMDGFETAAAIKQREKSRHTPIIFLTAEPSLRMRSYEYGAVDYVTKPYEADIVRSKVSVFVELYKRGQRIIEQEARLRQRELEEQQRRWLETVLDRTPTPLFLLDDASGDSQFANSAARALTDKHGALPAGVPFDGETHEFEWGGSTFMATGAGIPQAFGHRALRVLSLVDVTRLKQVEHELQNAINVRDDFLSIASHELHTPLTPLKLQLERLQRGSRATDDMKTKLGVAERQVDRLTKLVDQLLDVSRITRGKLRLHTEDVDLGAVVMELTQSLEAEAARNGSSLDVQIEKDVVGRWDPMRIEQIVLNLLSNAIKYGQGKPIEVGVSAQNGWARLSVRDHGIGVAPEQQARIFERFERAVTSRHYGGFGLGLWIVRQIVEASGGSVRVESEVGAGSTFTVELPR